MASKDLGPESHADALALAEHLRATLGRFVRGVKTQANTPTTAQSDTLALLDREGPLTVAELADRRNVRHQSMRLVAAQLESEGLVKKAPNPADGRSQLLSITESGQAELFRARRARTLQIAGLIEERLSAGDRRTLKAAIQIIERLC